jgi:hypothetical protein
VGTKYTTNTASGYNSSPPSDDGAQTASNLVTWAKHKTKLGDPIKTLAEDINTDLVTAFDYAPRRITVSDAVVAGDHMKTVEIAPTATTSVVVTLPDAATLGTIFRVFIKNSSPHQQSIARATGGDTIDGTAANITIPAKASYCITTNNTGSAADGFLILGCYPLEVTNLTEETAPAVSDTVAVYDLSATALRKMELAKLLKVINSLTEDTTPDKDADFLLTYDASASAVKKTLLNKAGITLATRVSLSGASVDFTGIPAWAKRVTVHLEGVSTSGTSPLLIQIGDAGGIEATTYVGSVSQVVGSGTVDGTVFSTGFLVNNASVGTDVWNGSMTIELSNAATNSWCARGVFGRSNSAMGSHCAGNKSLSATLDRVRLTTVGGTDTFDAGTMNISYE